MKCVGISIHLCWWYSVIGKVRPLVPNRLQLFEPAPPLAWHCRARRKLEPVLIEDAQ